ncbi:MAG TPA: VOC family protein [Allosphingosinicella sp.]|jgi:PhnB protein
MSVRPIPEGYHSVTPYITVDDAAGAIRFYQAAFGAAETLRMEMGGKVGHAEIRIGDSVIMLSDEWPHMGVLGPKTRGGATSSLMIYTEDVDAAFAQAVEAGGTVERPVQDQFYGDRSGTLVDPFGHRWTIATHVEDVSEEEMRRRMAEHAGGETEPA